VEIYSSYCGVRFFVILAWNLQISRVHRYLTGCYSESDFGTIATVLSLNKIHIILCLSFSLKCSTISFGTVVRLLVPLIVKDVSVMYATSSRLICILIMPDQTFCIYNDWCKTNEMLTGFIIFYMSIFHPRAMWISFG